ncbi:chloride channel protein [Leptospira levettii]|uniref:chloride channel protein n=1 Tax=Leptospira levettii TaxID=2023178 RepID=UPI00223D875C|nr:chloride channel protein [Leptospira levettii]MCW7475278.1 chloride channel protein [Leptospira levettii]
MDNIRFGRTKESISFFVRWSLIIMTIAGIVGSISAFFLHALEFVSEVRENHIQLLYFLPLAGLFIGWFYHHLGSNVNKGNNLLLEEIHSPSSVIPIRMTPFVLVGTLFTHLFGGSAGREGTAVQMGGSIAHQIVRVIPMTKKEQESLIILGMSAGFSAVFGTPIAAAIFSIEVILVGSYRWKLFLPSLITAWLSHEVCLSWNVTHPLFPKVSFDWNFTSLVGIFVLAIVSGYVAKSFIHLLHFFSSFGKKWILYPPFRPIIGGILLVCFFMFGLSLDYFGLGVKTIQNAFIEPLPKESFVWKLLLTTITIGFGFKGGEVTPLFFIGATLGNLFATLDPIHLALLTSVGFISVFSGATNTPLACAIMGMELFGYECGILYLVVTQIAFIISGHTSIYSSQIIAKKKLFQSAKDVGKRISDL